MTSFNGFPTHTHEAGRSTLGRWLRLWVSKCEIRHSRQITLGTNEASNSGEDKSDPTFRIHFSCLFVLPWRGPRNLIIHARHFPFHDNLCWKRIVLIESLIAHIKFCSFSPTLQLPLATRAIVCFDRLISFMT